MFHGLTPRSVRKLAYEMACINNLKTPAKWAEKQEAAEDWFTSFMKRHTNLSVRSPEATSLARATAFNEHNIKCFFDLLEPLISKLATGGQSIFNLDETGCTTVQRVPKVVSKKGMKQVGQVTSRERGELVTMCAIVSATGATLPPAFVFPRKNYRDVFLHGAPEGSLGLVNDSGWMNSINFVKVLQHIVKYIGCSPDKQIILVMDNHESHINLNSVIFAKDHGINIVTLPPHTSNKTQPLDLSVFGPFKTYFNGAANGWMLAHPGKTISVYQMAELMGEAWLRAANPMNIISGFKTSGIWPVNRYVFQDDQFLPSSVTDRDLPVSAALPTLSSASLLAADVGNSVSATSLPSPTIAAVPSTSEYSSTFVSPREFRGYPKVSPEI